MVARLATVTGATKMPKPPRITVLSCSAAGAPGEADARTEEMRRGLIRTLRYWRSGRSARRAPRNFPPESAGSGFLAYAAMAAARWGLRGRIESVHGAAVFFRVRQVLIEAQTQINVTSPRDSPIVLHETAK